ncbi:MAG TPA: nucleoside monophosphate kinase [Candidatus Saccharimonadales bacterium]|nr:nucleoside monophosphate kinase [Candidatus Saccharimonadales bacterium]
MQKKHFITIAGKPGSGKSTASKAVATELGYQHFSSGDLFRAIGKERGINVLEANLSGEQGADIDHLVDQRLRDIGSTEDSIVIDSRTAWHWVPSSFKVYLDLDLITAAERILLSTSAERLEVEHIPADPKEYAEQLQQRLESEARRYQKFYNINPYDTSNYDLVVDTRANNSQQVIALIIDSYRDWLNT